MQSVAIVADTTAYLPADLVSRTASTSSASTSTGRTPASARRTCRASTPSTSGCGSADRLPTTSQPSIGDFLDVYGPLVDAGQDVVSVHISGAISGTVESARQAKEQLAERKGVDRVHVVDSESACGGMAFTVLAGARAAEAGASAGGGGRARPHDPRAPEDVVRRRHPRVPAPRAGASAPPRRGSARRSRSSRSSRSNRRSRRSSACARAPRHCSGWSSMRSSDMRTAPTHGSSSTSRRPTRPPGWSSRSSGSWAGPPLFVSEVGPVIGTHVGPGLLGVGGVPPSDLE